MRTAFFTSQFKKDLKLAERRRKDTAKLKAVMTVLIEGGRLAENHRDHPLKGVFVDYRECHIEPDWLLIYKLHAAHITFVRNGTHSDLFG